MMAAPWSCLHCEARVFVAVDSVTGERVLVDRDPVPGGTVQLREVGRVLIADDHITSPAPRQPAYQLHDRTCSHPPVPVPVDLSDDPVRERSGGWRR